MPRRRGTRCASCIVRKKRKKVVVVDEEESGVNARTPHPSRGFAAPRHHPGGCATVYINHAPQIPALARFASTAQNLFVVVAVGPLVWGGQAERR